MSEFTKGLWEVESVDSGYVLRASDEHKTWVAQVIQGYPSTEQKANAHLISAAPDYYNAVKEFLDESDKAENNSDILSAFHNAYPKLRIIQAKAEGKS